MKIKYTLIAAILIIASNIQAIRIKTDSANSLLFSSTNYKNNDKPKVMENVIIHSSTKVSSRIVRL